MSRQLINHSLDLKKLQDEGYEVSVYEGVYLKVSGVPYVSSTKEIKFGSLVSKLELAGNQTVNPVQDHVVYFIGEHPHNADGTIITAIQLQSKDEEIHPGLTVNHRFSNKFPDRLYYDYHEKITRYINIISSQAKTIDSSVNAKTFNPIASEEDPESMFYYYDTNSSRAEIGLLTAKFKGLKIAIVGLGGTGAYILDQVAKTPVKEIHLFDVDLFLQHNAFRSPGAASLDMLKEKPKKVHYLAQIYSKMHKYVIPHDYNIAQNNIGDLGEMNFVFICIDKAEPKRDIIASLTKAKIPYIDTGIGIEIIDDKLRGASRQTFYADGDPEYLSKRISFSDEGNDDYAQNIQIAEINSLSASLAIIKWKKFLGFYHDLGKEYNSSYAIDINSLFNNEIRA